jgi:exopolyphosphatase/guanosine-5'-triphosphate,3'-diphosphate pyrophosphatase
MIAAQIDIGTNSIKLVVGERQKTGGYTALLREDVLITRLGEGLSSTGRISPEAAQRTLEGIEGFVAQARGMGAESIRAVATAALRLAANGGEFTASVKARTGVPVEVISGDEEARLTRSAVLLDPALGAADGELVTVDTGGGSTELTGPGWRTSLELGAVSLHERFVRHDPPLPEEVESAATHAERILRGRASVTGQARVVAMGGTAVNLARMARGVPCEDYLRVHGLALSAREIGAMIDSLAAMTISQRRGMVGLDPERADVILTGAIILASVLRALGAEELVVSVRGLRHGLLYEMLGVQK